MESQRDLSWVTSQDTPFFARRRPQRLGDGAQEAFDSAHVARIGKAVGDLVPGPFAQLQFDSGSVRFTLADCTMTLVPFR